MLYNPLDKDKKSLIKEFVVRTKVFDDIYSDIKNSKMTHPEQHYLIVGQRGAGKTTLLQRLKYAVEDDTKLKNVIPIIFSEEQHFISELANIWEGVAEQLEEISSSFKGLPKKMDLIPQSESFEENCFNLLSKSLKENGKKIIIFLDNFGELLAKLQEIEIKRLREILMTSNQIRLIVASPTLLAEVMDYKKPFLDFFKIVSLSALGPDEIKILLLQLAEVYGNKEKILKIIEENPSRIEILRRLTGGVIRTIALMFGIFLESDEGKSVSDLQLTLDAVTPLYKHKMDDLPKFQQKIIDTVAKNWDAISTKEISKKTRIESKAVSSYLSQLEKIQIIEKETTNTKNNLYRVKERFFNIWYLMRYGKKSDRRRVIWLVKFLESWCDKIELESRARKHIQNLATGHYDKSAALLMGEAYVSCNKLSSSIKYEVSNSTKKTLKEESESLTLEDPELQKLALDFLSKSQYDKAMEVLSQIKNRDKQTLYFLGSVADASGDKNQAIEYFLEAVKLDNSTEALIEIYGEIAIIYKNDNQFENAIQYFNKAIDLGSDKGAHSLAHLMANIGRDNEAEEYFNKAIQMGNSGASLCLAHFYGDKGEYNKAIEVLNDSLKKKRSASVLDRLGLYHGYLGDLDLANSFFEESISLGNKKSIIGRGYLLMEFKKDYEGAIKYFLQAKELKVEDADLYLTECYVKLKKYELAKEIYEKGVSKNDPEAMHGLAHLYAEEFKDFESAQKYFKMAIENGKTDAKYCLSSLYFEEANSKYKIEALELVRELYLKTKSKTGQGITYALALLWNNEIEESLDVIKPIISKEVNIEKHLSELTEYFILLISKEQKHLLAKLFFQEGDILKEAIKPVYFGLMKLMVHEYPNEYLRMGSEISETVNEILELVKEYKIKYK